MVCVCKAGLDRAHGVVHAAGGAVSARQGGRRGTVQERVRCDGGG